VRSENNGTFKAKTGAKMNVALTSGEWKFENEAGVKFGEAEFKKMIQPGRMFLVRLDVNNKPIDLLDKGQFNTYDLKNIEIVPLTDDLKKEFKGGLKHNTGVYVLKVVPDLKNLEKETSVNIDYEFLDTSSSIDLFEEAELDYHNTFISELSLKPKKLEAPLQMDQYSPANIEYKIRQNYDIPLDYFRYGSSKIDFQSFCKSSSLSEHEPCIVTGVKDKDTRTIADIHFYRKPGSAKSIFARIYSRPDMDISDPDGKLYKTNQRGEKKPLYDEDFRKKFWKTNSKGEKEVLLPIQIEAGNKVGKKDSALLELNHSFGDWFFPDSEDGYDCDKLKKTKFGDGGYGFMGLSELENVQRALLSSTRETTDSHVKQEARIAWKIGVKLSLRQITKTLRSSTGQKYICIDEKALLENANGMNPNQLAEVLVSGSEGIQLEVGDSFYTEGYDYDSRGRSTKVRTRWQIGERNGQIISSPIRTQVIR
jgi:hypothetical protein